MQKTSTFKNKTKDLLFNNIDLFCDQHNILNKKDTVIVACSGGSDSVFLAHYLFYRSKLIGFSVILAYFDHEWRKESKDEMVFCRKLAENLEFEFVTNSASAFKEKIKYNGSKEEMARELRYAFLHDILKQKNAKNIVVAHHLDDQIETFFIRLLRGSSLTGLCGMKAENNQLLRPLLEISKKEIVNWLIENTLAWCTDQTNNDTKFLRNKVRHQVIPALENCDNRFVKNTEKLIKRLQNTNDYLEKITDNIYKEITCIQDNGIYLCIAQFLTQEKEMQYRILLRFLIQHHVQFNESEKFFEEMLRFLGNTASRHACSSRWVLQKQIRFCVCCDKEELSMTIIYR